MDGYNFYQTTPTPEPSAPQKKNGKGGAKRVFTAALAAIVFGAVAAGTFAGTTMLINHFSPIESSSTVSTNTENNGQTASASVLQATATVSSNKIEGTSVSGIVENSIPFTVAVNCTFTSSSWFGQYTSEGSGTGIIVKENETELLIVTNNHVVDKAKTISVVFADGTKVSAVAKGTDSTADLAVIAVKLADITEETKNAISFAKLGNSDEVKVGEMVVAIGNALGYGQSVTVGYISAKDRSVTVDGNTMTLLQTDAAINPGNSGGALINMNGEVIGINSVKYADAEVEGMGFAIPVSNVTEIIEDLMNQLSADEKGYIGIYISEVTEEIANYYSWPRGIYVRSFTENSAAEEAGIQIGDIITAVNGNEVLTSDDLVSRVTAHKYGTKVEVTLQRKVDGEWKEFTYEVTLSQSSDYTTKEQNNTEKEQKDRQRKQ
ncbi:MAG: trypsin-like peptidase domain-containing protein [Lachnospiraceae bacterium]|nr:trypsin-like peptidase domain-containing protein [Lachnospiraceae bacterium]